jgi:hypothetical protein
MQFVRLRQFPRGDAVMPRSRMPPACFADVGFLPSGGMFARMSMRCGPGMMSSGMALLPDHVRKQSQNQYKRKQYTNGANGKAADPANPAAHVTARTAMAGELGQRHISMTVAGEFPKNKGGAGRILHPETTKTTLFP